MWMVDLIHCIVQRHHLILGCVLQILESEDNFLSFSYQIMDIHKLNNLLTKQFETSDADWMCCI